MPDTTNPEHLLRHLTETWDDADTRAARDELAAKMHPDPYAPRTPDERAAVCAARDDGKRAKSAS